MSALLGRLFLVVVLPFYHFKNVPRPLACRVSVEKSADTLREFLCVIRYCSFVAFNVFSLSLTFADLITVGLDMFLLVLILPGTLYFLELSLSFLVLWIF